MRRFVLLGAAALGLFAPGVAGAQTPIKISYQPTNYWALPFYVATKMNWWAKVGLKPSFVLFPAGVPQMAAAAAGSWDVGATGSVPAVLGAARFHVLTIGIDNDESATNVLVASAKAYPGLAANPKSIAGKRILLTTNSTVDYAVRSCLAHWGVPDSQVSLVNLGQAPIVTSIISGNAELGGLWAPYSYEAMQKAHAKVLCSGKAAGVVIPGVLVARAAYAKAHPDLVAAYLAVYVHAWAWAKAHPKEAASMLQAADVAGGVPLTSFGLKEEFTRPTFSLQQELALMDASHGPSKLEQWMGQISAFMQKTGSLPKPPATASYVTDAYMKRVGADAKLRAFAESAN
ncbi:MAG: ABC transporter substrate-binding protein [Rhodospirillales bacterium]|nr:ABC transporter substrate-binding protein [Rhodospirillales bacterium]